MHRIYLLSLVTLAASCRYTAPAKPVQEQATTETESALAVANRTFTYAGHPIHPLLVHEFDGWISDRGPVTLAVDVSNAEGNEYQRRIVRLNGREVWCEVPKSNGGTPGESCGYEHLGVLRDQTHVLRTYWSGGGTGVFEDLLFVRFSKREPLRLDGNAPGTRKSTTAPARRPRLIMTVVDYYILGDRSGARVELRPDRVIVRESQSVAPRAVIRIEDLEPAPTSGP